MSHRLPPGVDSCDSPAVAGNVRAVRLALSSYTHHSWWDRATSYLENTFDRTRNQQELAKQVFETLAAG